MRYMYTNKPDKTCHEINGTYGRPVNRTEERVLSRLGWTLQPVVKKAEKSMKEQALELGLPVEENGKPIHHKTLAKMIEAKNDESGTSTEST